MCFLKTTFYGFSEHKKYLWTYVVLITMVSYQGFAQDNSAPVVSAEGDQLYCPLTTIPIVTAFNIVDADDDEIDQFSIQISEGYQRGDDILRLTGTNLGLEAVWNEREGKLTLTGPNGGAALYSDLIPAVQNVVFESTSDNPTAEKLFSLTVGSANFLPETGHYYEYVPFVGIPWNEARNAAQNRTFFGLQGYLVTITSPAEAQLSGEQAAGTGWIGGSDAQLEGTWRWETGPEAGQVFWNGDFNGSSPTYAFWNTREPNNTGGENGVGEDYAHITAPGVGILGSWNDLPLQGSTGAFEPQGYVVEYGGLPGDPVLNLSASTRLTIPKIIDTVTSEVCGEGIAVLMAESSIGDIVWFDAPANGIPIANGNSFETPVLNQSTTFYVLASFNGCLTGERTPVDVLVKTPPVINDAIVITNCDEDGVPDGFTDFNLTEYEALIASNFTDFDITYYVTQADADASINPQSATSFNNSITNQLFYRVQGSGVFCHTIGSATLVVSTTSFPDDFLFELQACDAAEGAGSAIFNLEEAEAEMLAQFPNGQELSVSFFRTNEDAILRQNSIQNKSSYENTDAFSETLYVRVDDELSGTCFGIGEHLLLTVLPIPSFSLEDNYPFCSGDSVTIEPFGAAADYQYSWFNANDELIGSDVFFETDVAGEYYVIAMTINGCVSELVWFTVVASSAPQFSRDLIKVANNADSGTITILNDNNELGLGDYEFSLDNVFGPFQSGLVFEEVSPGLHTIFAVDRNGCGTDEITVGVIGFPNFFTPNNDNANDEINVLGVTKEFYRSAILFIFDRYGKLIAQKDASQEGWDGFYNGSLLPPSDYWYRLELIDYEGLFESRNGHFTLKQ